MIAANKQLGVCENEKTSGGVCGQPLFWVDTIYGGLIESGECAECDEDRAGGGDES